MKTNQISKLLFAIWALLGSPLFFGLYDQCMYTYWYPLTRGNFAHVILPEILWYIAFGFCLFSGCFALQKLLHNKFSARIIISAVYLLVMTSLILFLAYKIAFANGDSL